MRAIGRMDGGPAACSRRSKCLFLIISAHGGLRVVEGGGRDSRGGDTM